MNNKGNPKMQAYSINYEFKNKYGYIEKREALVDASSLKYAKKKLMRKRSNNNENLQNCEKYKLY